MFLQIVTFPQITLQKSYEVLGYVKQGVLLVSGPGELRLPPLFLSSETTESPLDQDVVLFC